MKRAALCCSRLALPSPAKEEDSNGKDFYEARPAKFSTRKYNRCKLCGRPHAYLRNYGVCRICFRELAYKGEIPGVRKASF